MASLRATEVQAAIAKAGHNWQARDTRISKLARNARAGNLFGLNIGDPERRDLLQKGLVITAMFKSAVPAPTKVDWRANGGNWVTPIRNQATCGSCVAHATCAALESRALIKNSTPGVEFDLSESHLFACGGGKCGPGWNFEPALKQAKSAGVGPETAFPYQPVDVPCKSIPPKVKVADWAPITATNARKLAIAKYGPVIAGMRVYSDFFSYGSGIYKHTIGDLEGLHAVAVVGYSDPDQCWIVKNSWSPDWGEKGFVRMGYNECGIDSEFPFFDASVDVLGAVVS